MSRMTRTATDTRAGCFDCNGSDAIWLSRNAMALAARHHDATGHATWADQLLTVRFGEQAGGGEQPDMFQPGAAP